MTQQEKAMNVLKFYNLTRRLKNTIRSGWRRWNVRADRLESIAEHVYGTCMLAIAINSEFDYDVDIQKVVCMLSIHELEETIIGDITPFDMVLPCEKRKIGSEAVMTILQPMVKCEEYINLIEEFEKKETKEAKFAHFCDVLEADLMSFKYDFDGQCKYEYADIKFIQHPDIASLKNKGANSMRDFFYKYDSDNAGYDDNFKAMLDLAKALYY